MRPNHGTFGDHNPIGIENILPQSPRLVQMGKKTIVDSVRMSSSWMQSFLMW